MERPKWLALAFGVVALPVSLLGAYFADVAAWIAILAAYGGGMWLEHGVQSLRRAERSSNPDGQGGDSQQGEVRSHSGE